ncbi:MAG: hypothetical protein ABJL17_13880 [Parvibaculum sp.]|uniref:hypothetical protein n=1 Tax=Parvibaculum sp. TaxID=2024848 RepID=UPI0032664C8A
MLLPEHMLRAILAIGLCAALLIPVPAAAEQKTREDAIAACVKYMIPIGDTDPEPMLEKVAQMDWRAAQAACVESFVPGEIGWREAYTYAQARQAQWQSLRAAGKDRPDEDPFLPQTYLSPSLVKDNAEPYLFNAYLALSYREPYIRELAKAPEDRAMKVEESIRRTIWGNGRTAERLLFMSACFGSPKALDVLSDFYTRNALDDIMLPVHRRMYERNPEKMKLLAQAREGTEGAARLLAQKLYAFGIAAIVVARSWSRDESDWRKETGLNFLVVSSLAKARGWERLAGERGEAIDAKDEGLNRKARLEMEKYMHETCGPFLAAQDLFAVSQLEFQPRLE